MLHRNDIIKKLFRVMGFKIERYSYYTDNHLRLAEVLRQKKVTYAIDVGANEGQFAKALFMAGFDGNIVSFEPLPEAHSALLKQAQHYSGRWTIAPRMALGAASKAQTLHVSANGFSSLFRTASQALTMAAPEAAANDSIEVGCARLDEVLPSFVGKGARSFLKLDTQGTELEVLQGAEAALCEIDFVLTEVAFCELYFDQALAAELDDYLRSKGYTLIDIWPGFRRPVDYRLLECDFLYGRL